MPEYAYRPIALWPGKSTSLPRSSPFKAEWRKTLIDLDREIRALGGREFVIEMFVDEADIRIDGQLRAGTYPGKPGVIVSFNSRHGRMRYPCDRFNDWRHNVRAIVLTLEHLRGIDRYGVTAAGEQYTAWKALPAPNRGPADEIKTPAHAISFLDRLVERGVIPDERMEFATAIRKAEFATHPDRGGNAEDFKRVQRCRELLLAK